MMLADVPGQCLFQGGQLDAQASHRSVRHLSRIGPASDQSVQDRPGRHPLEVAGDGRELDVGVFQDLLQAVDGCTALGDQASAIAGEIAQVPLLDLRDEALLQEAEPHELRNPLGVGDVRLVPRHLLEVLGIDHPHLHKGLQDVVDRFPIDPRAFHRHVGDAEADQPLSQLLQARRRRPEGSDQTPDAALRVGDQYTSGNTPLVDVQASAMRKHHFHLIPPAVVLAYPIDWTQSVLRVCHP
jgi:hypothetical protein